MGNVGLMPVEVAETSYAVRILRTELIPGSQGLGNFNGGLGIRREYLVLGAPQTATLYAEQTDPRFRPRGARGGLEGAPSRITVTLPDGSVLPPMTKFTRRLPPGTVVRVETAGGGGFGDPAGGPVPGRPTTSRTGCYPGGRNHDHRRAQPHSRHGRGSEFTAAYGREGSLCIYRSAGMLPSHHVPTEAEWEASGLSLRGMPIIGPAESARDHPGFDKVVVLAISPQFLDGHLIGTVDVDGRLGVPGPPHPDKCNDYIAAVVAEDPGRFIGFASVNPAYQGPRAAVAELDRAVTGLGLTGLKLYPMYQHWAANDRDLAFPIYQKASELGIPVMIHQAGSTRIDAKLELGLRDSRRHRA